MPETFDRQRTLQAIADAIAPFVGRSMAQASLDLHCEKLGIADDRLSPDELEALLERLRKALVVFVGQEKTTRLLREVAAGVRPGVPAP